MNLGPLLNWARMALWVQNQLGPTLTSQRTATYREYRRATGSATKLATTS